MSEEQEQAALLLERCRDKLSGHEIEVCERASSSNLVSQEEIDRLYGLMEDANNEFMAAEAAWKTASENGPKKGDEDALTRLCTEFADHLK